MTTGLSASMPADRGPRRGAATGGEAERAANRNATTAANPTTGVESGARSGLGMSSAATPHHIGKYEVIRLLGAGAMGVVYECRQPELDRSVAIKVLRHFGGSRSDQTHRFEREARAAAQLSHPHVVRVYDVGVDGELPYLVMEYVPGDSLDHLIGDRYLSFEVALRIAYHTALGLQAAHDVGIVHRDLKPSNILIDPDGRPRIVDFGLAKSLSDNRSLSGSGDLIGTPRYMAPEQVTATVDEIDGRTDVYALGVVLYEMLAGRPPFDGPNVLSILRQLTDDEPPDLLQFRPELWPEIAQLCRAAMAKEPAQRISSARAFADRLREIMVARMTGTAIAAPSLSGTPTSLSGTPLATDVIMASFVPLTPRPTALRRLSDVPSTVALSRIRARSTGAVLVALFATVLAAIGGTLYWGWTTGWFASETVYVDIYNQLRSPLLDAASQRLSGPLKLATSEKPREIWKSTIEDLTALVRANPEDTEVRLLRGRVYRRAGEFLAAIDDFSRILDQEPGRLEVRAERALAVYGLWILYWGHLNLPLVRFDPPAILEEDLKQLDAATTEGAMRYLSLLIRRLRDRNFEQLESFLEAQRQVVRPDEWKLDFVILEADLLLRAADRLWADAVRDGEDPTDNQELQRLARLGTQALQQRGLDVDGHSPPLLFLKANSLQSPLQLKDTSSDDRASALKSTAQFFRPRLALFRDATLGLGCETPLACSVLFANRDRMVEAKSQITEAIDRRRGRLISPSSLETVRAALSLEAPDDGELTPVSLRSLLDELQPAFETSPEEPQPYLVRALIHAARLDFERSRRDLKECQTRLGEREWVDLPDVFQDWLNQAYAPATEYRYALLLAIDDLDLPEPLIEQAWEVLATSLANPAVIVAEGIDSERLRELRSAVEFQIAVRAANQEQRDKALQHLEQALEFRHPNVTAENVVQNGAFNSWLNDPDFAALLQKFPVTPAPADDPPDSPEPTDEPEADMDRDPSAAGQPVDAADSPR